MRPDLAGLALQRAGHVSPVSTRIDHDGAESTAKLEWFLQDMEGLKMHDNNRVTEDGAEAVAISYVRSKEGWIAKRRWQRWEYADWLLQNSAGWLAMEVSGTAEGDPVARLKEKKQQVARCKLSADRLAVVVAFDRPSILAGCP